MTFFDQKQEVIDVTLTQFGKELFSRGAFRPAFYQFFDDGILYDSKYADIEEIQNETETRILKNTPRLKTPHLTFSVNERYSIEEKEIESGERGRFETLRRFAAPDIQDRILLYPLASQEISNQNIAKFDILSLEAPIEEVISLSSTEKGIQKNTPTLRMAPKYRLLEERKDLLPKENQTMITKEDFVDLVSEEIVFSDNSKLIVDTQNIVIDVEELNCFDGPGNFYLNIYEVSNSESGNTERVIRKIDSMEMAEKFFKFRKDKEIEKYKMKEAHEKNYEKRGKN